MAVLLVSSFSFPPFVTVSLKRVSLYKCLIKTYHPKLRQINVLSNWNNFFHPDFLPNDFVRHTSTWKHYFFLMKAWFKGNFFLSGKSNKEARKLNNLETKIALGLGIPFLMDLNINMFFLPWYNHYINFYSIRIRNSKIRLKKTRKNLKGFCISHDWGKIKN